MDIQKNTTYLKHISTIQRCTQKYFETALSGCKIGYGQQFFLLRISEQEGISFQELAKKGNYDKTTVTKAVQKLLDEGLVISTHDARDRRIHRLCLTDKARELVEHLYQIRDRWKELIASPLSPDEREQMERILEKMAERAWELTEKGGF